MYKPSIRTKTRLTPVEKEFEAISLENKIEAIVSNKDNIPAEAPEIFTAREDGIIQAYNVRTDRWELATEGMDIVEANATAKREAKALMDKGKVVDMKTGKEVKEDDQQESGA